MMTEWELRVAGQQECLAGQAYAAADAALILGIVSVDLGRQDCVSEEQAFWDNLLDLDRHRRAYVNATQRDDAIEIIYEAAEYWAGASIASIITGALELEL